MAAAARAPRGFGMRAAFLDEAKKFIAGRAAELMVQLIPADWVTKAADKLPDSLLTDGDSREKWASGISLALDAIVGLDAGHRTAIASFLEQSAEEIGKRKDDLDGKGEEKDRKVIRAAMEKHRAKLDALKSTDQGKPSDKTVLQAVGELKPDDQKKFWVIVDRLQKKLNGGDTSAQPNQRQPSDEVIRLINRVKLTKEQLTTILFATPDSLQEDLLFQALKQSTAAGGIASGIQRFFERTQRMLERAMGDDDATVDPAELARKMHDKNEERKIEDDDVSGIR